MASLLFLTQRIPYPPDKGDKLRSYAILRHLAHRWTIDLGCFIDDPADHAHLDALRPLCASLHAVDLRRRVATLASGAGLLLGTSLSERYFHARSMSRWVDGALSRGPAAIFVYSGVMGQYVLGRTGGARLVTDLVDVDSEKWRQYAERRRGPAAWIYRREARTVLRLERRLAQASDATLFVSEPEAALFRRRAPDCVDKVRVVGNGIDHAFFDPDLAHADPFPAGCRAIVLTGAMDYWPNIDAADFFQADVLPRIRAHFPDVCFYVVGRNPSARVRAFETDGVVVTGGVEDVRPYLRHAALVVAPMRIARGIQNKVLEGMAMARAVVTTPSGYEGLAARPGAELLIGTDAAELAAACEGLLADPARAGSVGAAARRRILADYNWPARLAGLDELL